VAVAPGSIRLDGGDLCRPVRGAVEFEQFGAPGLRFFYGISYLNLAFLTLLGISFFSTSISEEKEEDTLGLMLMAGSARWGS